MIVSNPHQLNSDRYSLDPLAEKMNSDKNPVISINGSQVMVYQDNHLMVNGTQLAKALKINLKRWLEFKGTSNFMEDLSKELGLPSSELKMDVHVTVLRTNVWLHERIALAFIQKYAPNLSRYVSEQLKDLSPSVATEKSDSVHELSSRTRVVECRYNECRAKPACSNPNSLHDSKDAISLSLII